MKQKTAMMCAIELIEQFLDGKITMAELSQEFKGELLEKEKEQIMNAYAENIDSMYPPEIGDEMCEDYYNETYKQDKRECFECGEELNREELFCQFCRRQD